MGNNTLARFQKSAMESDTKYGCMCLHDLSDLTLCLKLSWLGRLQNSNAKWTHLPRFRELNQTLQFSKDLCERNIVCRLSFLEGHHHSIIYL